MATKRVNFDFLTNWIDLKKIIFYFFMLSIITLSLNIISYGFSYPIIDLFGFRQAQTAITSYWFIEEGYKFNYITPVLGPPWSIPFEFPIYQYLVSFTQKVSGLTLDQSGRFVSILFYYVSATVLFFVFRALKFTTIQSYVPVILFLGSPFYLFWSRTFMIESTAIAFGLFSVLFFIKSNNSYKHKYVALAILFGVLSALTKITTFGIFLTFISIIFIMNYFESRRHALNISYRKLFVTIVPIIVVPLLVAMIWNNYADFLKSQNPLASFIVSENLFKWNFGTIEMKLALKTWLAVFSRGELIMGSTGFIVLGFVSFISKKVSWISLAAIASFLIGPIVFTNLYVVHEYYFYANGLFLLLFISGGIIALLEYRYVFTSIGIVLLILIVMQYKYHTTYPSAIKQSQHSSLVKVGLAVKAKTKSSDIIIVYGHDWDSTIPYYAQRKAIMDRAYGALENERMLKSLGMLDKKEVGAVLLCKYNKYAKYDDFFRNSRIEYFKLNEQPTRVGRCDVYYRKDS